MRFALDNQGNVYAKRVPRYLKVLLTAICIVLVLLAGFRIWQVNESAFDYPVHHYAMGESFDMSGKFFDAYAGEGDIAQGYSMVVDRAEVMTPNEYLSVYADGKTTSKKGGDEKSVVCLTITFTNQGKQNGGIQLYKYGLVTPARNCSWTYDEELFEGAYPKLKDQPGFAVAKGTSCAVHIPFCLQKRADYFDSYENYGRELVADDHYYLHVANCPENSWIDISI